LIKLLLGFIAGVSTVIFYPEALSWFIDSGIRDAMIERLNSL
jgi:hypothetical protein